MPPAGDDYKDESSENPRVGYANFSESPSQDKQTQNYGSNSKMETIRDQKAYSDNKFRAEGTLTQVASEAIFVFDLLTTCRKFLNITT